MIEIPKYAYDIRPQDQSQSRPRFIYEIKLIKIFEISIISSSIVVLIHRGIPTIRITCAYKKQIRKIYGYEYTRLFFFIIIIIKKDTCWLYEEIL